MDGSISYRPLSILDALPKLFEYILRERIMEVIEEDGFSRAQFGFHKGWSTLDALWVVRDFVSTAAVKQRYAVLISLDIKNAFNCLDWGVIALEMNRRSFPIYLKRILLSYFQDREIEVQASDQSVRRPMYKGVPQGSVIGPILWNVVYDGLLNRIMSEGCRVVGYADDVALLVMANTLEELEHKVQFEASGIETWLTSVGLTLAVQKTAVVFLNERWRPPGYPLPFLGQEIVPQKAIKYLGVYFDPRKNFRAHIEYANKAARMMGALSRLMPNVSPLGLGRRKMYYRVLESVILYAAPVWADAAGNAQNERWLRRTQKLGLGRVAASYRSASHLSLCVLAGELPIDIKARMRKKEYLEEHKKIRRLIVTEEDVTWAREDLNRRLQDVRIEAVEEWQTQWDSAAGSRWTYSWLPKVTSIGKTTHANVDFYITQMLTGHGCFRAFLHEIQRAETPDCWFGCEVPDDANHTFFECNRWEIQRWKMWNEMNLDRPYSPIRVMNKALSSHSCWTALVIFCHAVLRIKQEHERALEKGGLGAADPRGDPLEDIASLFI